MNIVIWLLTVILVLDCLILMLLVLIQLPKKEAGLGQAFGGGATDALFGAGSGNVLTKLTKYATGVFFVLTLLISVLHGHQARAKGGDPRSRLSASDKLADIAATAPAKPSAAVPTNKLLLTNALQTSSNTAPAVTNPVPAAAPPVEKPK